jgi:hypothetical protein
LKTIPVINSRTTMTDLRISFGSARFPFIVVLLILLALAYQSSGGVIDLLKGEPPARAFQRVAFVGTAVVKQVDGAAERLVGIDRWKPLKAGEKLAPGDLVRTKEGSVVLRMAESGSFVKVTPNTMLRLVEIEERWDRGVLSGTEERRGFIVRSCRGNAFRRSGVEWKPIEVNTVLVAGTEVRTEAGVVLDLFNTEAHRPVRIPGSSRVTLDEAMLASRVLVQPNLAAADVGGSAGGR